jgi:hypothetical protein
MSAKMYITLTILGDTGKNNLSELYHRVAYSYFHVANHALFSWAYNANAVVKPSRNCNTKLWKTPWWIRCRCCYLSRSPATAGVVPTWRETNATSVLKIRNVHEIFTLPKRQGRKVP